jgi:hypothetical protein
VRWRMAGLLGCCLGERVRGRIGIWRTTKGFKGFFFKASGSISTPTMSMTNIVLSQIRITDVMLLPDSHAHDSWMEAFIFSTKILLHTELTCVLPSHPPFMTSVDATFAQHYRYTHIHYRILSHNSRGIRSHFKPQFQDQAKAKIYTRLRLPL